MTHQRGCGSVLGLCMSVCVGNQFRVSPWLEWVGRCRWGWSDGLGNEAVCLRLADWRIHYLLLEARRARVSRVCGSAANDSGLLLKSDSADVSVGGAVQPGWFSLHLNTLHASVALCSITDKIAKRGSWCFFKKAGRKWADLPQTWAAFKVIL